LLWQNTPKSRSDPSVFKHSLKFVRTTVAFPLYIVLNIPILVLMDIDLLARSGGMKVLLHVLGDGPSELAPIIASAFLHIIDSPRTRASLCVGTDIEVR
jgi:large subunit ribosomal protein L17e